MSSGPLEERGFERRDEVGWLRCELARRRFVDERRKKNAAVGSARYGFETCSGGAPASGAAGGPAGGAMGVISPARSTFTVLPSGMT